MKILLILMVFLAIACGKDNKSSGGGNGLSSNPYKQSTVTGYLWGDGRITVGSTTYQMMSNTLSNQQLNQQLMSSGIQPTYVNGVARFKARITGSIYNPCQQQYYQNTGYNQQPYYGGTQCNNQTGQRYFNVTAVQFIR